ncbi:unnamed protein product, partial [Mesorhabditis belari]|uniref:glutaminase n=1 Tax=Mesorhabditis belari TaxID=2138241 RepID=A0AAF3F6D3_9BILA
MFSKSDSTELKTIQTRRSSATVENLRWLLSLNREATFSNGFGISRTLSQDSTARFSSHIQELIFDLYKEENDKILLPKFLKNLTECGIRRDDPRLMAMLARLREAENTDSDGLLDPESLYLDRETFKKSVGDSIGVISKALKGQLIIPDWGTFTQTIGEIFDVVRPERGGNVATYIPQLARCDPNYWAVAVCTIDGQRKSWGDANVPFCLQSVSKPFTYALCHEELGPEKLHSFVGQEPSGRLFNEICLDHSKKPHNPLINAGAIMCAALMKKDAQLADRFDFALRSFRRFAGNGFVGFNNSVFLSERDTADRNYALSYYMREHKCFPENTKFQDTMDLYFQLCSIEANVDSLAVMAATLANGGVNPLNGERIINNRACRDTLSLMYSCGMYDYSGMFAFKNGLPAKSGVSGDMIIVIPNVMGICIYSPRLDTLGNSVRGVLFADEFINRFNFHNYDSLVYSATDKLDPRKVVVEVDQDNTSRMMYAAKMGDIQALKRCLLIGMNIHERDYDDRTVLHVAACEANDVAIEFILTKWKESPEPRDRFGRTPAENALFFGHTRCSELLFRANEFFLGRIDE